MSAVHFTDVFPAEVGRLLSQLTRCHSPGRNGNQIELTQEYAQYGSNESRPNPGSAAIRILDHFPTGLIAASPNVRLVTELKYAASHTELRDRVN
jgi:hypothetical protein